MIDLRSDTVTQPSDEMREYMFQAQVGDDVFGEDPTVNALQTFAADYFGKEAALFCSSGTQTNQIAMCVHLQPGGEVICHEESHIYKYEGGGIARNAGASVRLLQGDRGRLKANDIAKWMNNPDDVHFPLTQLISLEDTANRGGGAIYDFTEIQQIKSLSEQLGIPLHLDGARMMNSLVETGIDPKVYASQFDSISLCLSKGLGAPIGSLLIGSHEFIRKARRVRKVFGGGMRQAGIIAAGGHYALKNNVERLKVDHNHAKALETALIQQDWIKEVLPVQTNIVVAILNDSEKRDSIIQTFQEKGIRIMPFGEGMLRMVTHLDCSQNDIDQVINAIEHIKI